MPYVPLWQRAQQKQQGTQQDEWIKLLAQARMAMALDGQTALGLALGKLIRGAWDSYKERGDDKKIKGDGTTGTATKMPMQSQPPIEGNYDFNNPIHDMVMKYQPATEKNPAESFEMQSTDFLPGMGNGFNVQRPSMEGDVPSSLEDYMKRYSWYMGRL